jgi:hypothetical protein
MLKALITKGTLFPAIKKCRAHSMSIVHKKKGLGKVLSFMVKINLTVCTHHKTVLIKEKYYVT